MTFSVKNQKFLLHETSCERNLIELIYESLNVVVTAAFFVSRNLQ